MKRILLATGLLASVLGLGILVLSSAESQAQSQTLPACAANGDMDSDGVLDANDSDETDSCLTTATGLEDCSTGAGDGLADCSAQ